MASTDELPYVLCTDSTPAHHWLLSVSFGVEQPATCTKCGATRTFRPLDEPTTPTKWSSGSGLSDASDRAWVMARAGHDYLRTQ